MSLIKVVRNMIKDVFLAVQDEKSKYLETVIL
jgi:hypothetical protein